MTTTEATETAQDAPDGAYEPPALVVLGSVTELTLGTTGSVMDLWGRGGRRRRRGR